MVRHMEKKYCWPLIESWDCAFRKHTSLSYHSNGYHGNASRNPKSAQTVCNLSEKLQHVCNKPN